MNNNELKAQRILKGLPEVGKGIIDILNENNINYAVIGGIAVARWSSPRDTGDIDFIVPASSRSKLEELFDTRPLSMPGRDGITTIFNDADVDFIFSEPHEDFFYKDRGSFLGLPVLGRNQLLYLKLASTRAKDNSDIVYICKNMSEQEREGFRKFLEHEVGHFNEKDEFIESFNTSCLIADLESKDQNKLAGAAFRKLLLKRYSHIL